MDKVCMDVQTRTLDVKVKDLLKQNIIPLVYYGRGVKNKHLQVDYQSFRKVYNQAGNSTLIELSVDDGKEKLPVLVQSVKYDPISDRYAHIDFVHVRMDEEVTTKVPLVFVGTSLAVKDFGGTFMSSIDELEVKCLPKDLLHSIEVDIEPLVDFNVQLLVKDIKVPKNITVLNGLDDVVASVLPPRVEEEVPADVEGEAGAEVGAEGGAVESKVEGGDKASGDNKKEEK